jgi:hypothetical protein
MNSMPFAVAIFFIVQGTIVHFTRKSPVALTKSQLKGLSAVAYRCFLLRNIPVIVLLLGFGVVMLLPLSWLFKTAAFVALVILLMLSALISSRFIIRKLSTISLPEQYIKHRIKWELIQSISVMIFMCWILWGTLHEVNNIIKGS